jgi:alkylhydroperoxidase family enzyme
MNSAIATEGSGFLDPPAPSAGLQRLRDNDVKRLGFVMNLSSLWGHHPDLYDGLSALLDQAAGVAGLTPRQRAVLVTSAASTLGDSYCSMAWGRRLAREAGADVAAAVLRGADHGLAPEERALAGWARAMTREPSRTGQDDVQPLRDAGFDDAQIFAITVFVSLRLAFAVVNDALGSRPDEGLVAIVPEPVRDAVTYGRPAVGSQHEGRRVVRRPDTTTETTEEEHQA